jgi:hypothetical protein
MNKRPKMDRKLVSKQEHEIDYLVLKFKEEGINLTREYVRSLKKELNTRSRKRLEAIIRERHPSEINDVLPPNQEELIKKIADDYGVPLEKVREAHSKTDGTQDAILAWLEENVTADFGDASEVD